jgi:Replication-relaxation
MVAESYSEIHRYEGAVLQHDRRETPILCEPQPRDVAIVRDVWRYKFLTAHQILELWWPQSAVAWPGQRRLRKLFDAGYLERFRPIARRGSYPWTYHLGEAGHALLQRAGVIPHNQRYYQRAIYDYGRVLHELQLNAWVLALRRVVGDALEGWNGELDIAPPPGARRAQLDLDDDWSVEDLKDPRARLIRPDAVLELIDEAGELRTTLVEYDRTRRVDKNYDKFRRYDAFLCWWWRHSPYADHPAPPRVLFICQTEEQRETFLAAADRELTGHRWHPSARPERYDYVGRRRILFALEHDAHDGRPDAWQLPPFPAGHPARDISVRRTRLARPLATDGPAADATRPADGLG